MVLEVVLLVVEEVVLVFEVLVVVGLVDVDAALETGPVVAATRPKGAVVSAALPQPLSNRVPTRIGTVSF